MQITNKTHDARDGAPIGWGGDRTLRVGDRGRTEANEGEANFVLRFSTPPTLEEIERVYLQQLLEQPGISRATIARILGISERNTYRLIARYALR